MESVNGAAAEKTSPRKSTTTSCSKESASDFDLHIQTTLIKHTGHSWQTVLPFLPAILLCLIAVAQLRLTRTDGLTPWKGGGFGMFSTTDIGPRLIGIRISGPGGERDIPPPASTDDEALGDALTFPSDENLEDLALNIAAIETANGTSVSRVRVAVWRLSYDRRTLNPVPEVVGDLVVEIPVSSRRP